MKKKYFFTLLISILFIGAAYAQEIQKNFINYQGVARSADSQLLASEDMTITIGLKFGAANAAAVYEENHSIMTDANGVFSLLIGNGSAITGNYNTLPWGRAATFITVSMNGTKMGTTELMAVPYAISSGDAKQSAAEVPYDNASSGLVATTAQEAIDVLAVGGTIDTDDQALVLTGDLLTIQDGAGSVDLSAYIADADADINNELQTLNFDPATNALSLSDGNTVIIPSGGTDADADPTNELQTISFDAATNVLSLSAGGTVTIPSGGTDADADPTNEFQTLSFDAGTNELSLSDGNVVTIPSGGTDADADPENEIDVTRRHGLLVGDDGIIDGLVGTANGQVAKWDAALGNWVAGTDETGGGGGSTLWSENGSDIFYETGNIGIGIRNPAALQQLHSSAARTNLHLTNGSSGALVTDGLQIGLVNDLGLGLAGYLINEENGPLQLGTNSATRIFIASGGNVGINTFHPAYRLDVDGDIRSTDLVGTGQRNVMADADGKLVIGAGGSGGSGLEALNEGSGIGWRLQGREAANYGAIGLNALDVSTNDVPSDSRGATGLSATASGEATTASGPRSTAMGYGARATGSVSISMGEETEASGESAVAMGDRTIASEQSSTAFGSATRAINTHATALGESTTASGKSSTAMGTSTKAESLGSLAIGRNNIGGGDPFVWQPNDPLFEVGNGSEVTAGNALTVLKNGKIGVGTSTPLAMLQVEGNIRSSDLSGGGNVIADANGNLVIGSGTSGANKIDDLLDGKSSVDYASLFLGTGAGEADFQLSSHNVGIGPFVLYQNETGKNNTATGSYALYNNIGGGYNVALGGSALFNNTSGNSNTAVGHTALNTNTTGQYNTATGFSALNQNENGGYNTAMGIYSLSRNTSGINNTANGANSLEENEIGHNNTANGYDALKANKTGSDNSAFGRSSIKSNVSGDKNTAVGAYALNKTESGSYNVALGHNALYNITSGSNNIGIGAGTLVPDATGSHQLRVGNNQITYAGVQVAWTVTSDARWKENVRYLPYGLAMVKQLRPVDYLRKNNDHKTREIGFIAQEVEAILTNLGYADQGFLTKDDQGFMSLRYNDFIPVLTKAIQEQQEIINSLIYEQDNVNMQLKELQAIVLSLSKQSDGQNFKVENGQLPMN